MASTIATSILHFKLDYLNNINYCSKYTAAGHSELACYRAFVKALKFFHIIPILTLILISPHQLKITKQVELLLTHLRTFIDSGKVLKSFFIPFNSFHQFPFSFTVLDPFFINFLFSFPKCSCMYIMHL